LRVVVRGWTWDETLCRGSAPYDVSDDDAGHAFFCTTRPMYRIEAALAAWPRVWDFLGRHRVVSEPA
jgi:dienelactone hydrolase